MKLVMSVHDNKEVSLLTDANFIRALEPREVISGQNGDPYAYAFKTQLGWCVVGPMIKQTKACKLVITESCLHWLTQ